MSLTDLSRKHSYVCYFLGIDGKLSFTKHLYGFPNSNIRASFLRCVLLAVDTLPVSQCSNYMNV